MRGRREAHATAEFARCERSDAKGTCVVGTFWSGLIDDVRIYNRVVGHDELSASSIQRKQRQKRLTAEC